MSDPPSTYRGLDWSLHNPGLLSRDQLISRFLIRKPLLDELIRQLQLQPPQPPLRHLLCVGQRGMGKTTLLLRLAYFAEDDAVLRERWQPVVFAEEQYQIGDLADFFLEILRALSQSVGSGNFVLQPEDLLKRDLPTQALAEEALQLITAFCEARGKRLLLLIDNVNAILGQLGEQEAHFLRKVLMTGGYMLVIGAASTHFAEIAHYDQPFYDFFRVYRLEGLDEQETKHFLMAMAEHNRDEAVVAALNQHPERVRHLRRLTGGNPRIVLFLYRLLHESPDGEIRRDLERLLDELTPFYKHRLESLPPQQRRIFDAIARHWHPLEVGDLVPQLRLQSNAISAQIKRLVDQGYVEEAGGSRKQKRYQVAERMYNIYYLMRFSRPGRQQLQWLVLFFKAFYEQDHLRPLARRWIERWRLDHSEDVTAAWDLVQNLGALAQALEGAEAQAAFLWEMLVPFAESEGLSREALQVITQDLLVGTAAEWRGDFGESEKEREQTGPFAAPVSKKEWTTWMQRARPWLRRLVQKDLWSAVYETDDLVQEILARVHASAHQYQGKAPFDAWVRAVARNWVRSIRRRDQAQKRAYLVGGEDLDAAADQALMGPGANPLESVIKAEQRGHLQEVLAQLPPRHLQVLEMLYGSEHSIAEVAVRLGVSEKAVSSLAWRALRGLSQLLKEGAPDSPIWKQRRLMNIVASLVAQREGDKALAAMEDLLRSADGPFLEQTQEDLIHLAMRIAALGYSRQMAELIARQQTLSLKDRWLPLRAALDADAASDPERLRMVAPEVRQAAQDVLDVLTALRSAHSVPRPDS